MNKFSFIEPPPDQIFDFNISELNAKIIETFNYQYASNNLYKLYCDTLAVTPAAIKTINQIPFLPISFFKTHKVTSTQFEPAVVFESSGTTQSLNSKHYVKNLDIYTKSFSKGFELFYGNPGEYCIIGLLPSYLERQNSSLVLMVDRLVQWSGHPQSGFYLNNFDSLAATLQELENRKQKTLLIGVTFALLDFAEAFPMPLQHTTIMETGGMKGRKEEMIRPEVHEILKTAFKVDHIHSEYGMTELLSQAYSRKNGIFECPPWLQILLRSEDDPFEIIHHKQLNKSASGVINVLDLANIYSCSFIATDDAGRLYPDGSFEVLGRTDNSDIRGCSLLAL